MSTLSQVTQSGNGTVSGVGRKSTLAQLAEAGYTMKTYNPNGSTLQKLFSGAFDSPARANNQGSGLLYTIERLGLGAFGMLEGIWDYTAGGIAKLFGADEWAEAQFADNITGRALNDLNEAYNPSSAMQVVGDIAGGVGNSVPAMAAVAAAAAIAYFSGGSLTPVSISIISGVTAGLGAAGMSTTAAYEKTGELGGKEFLYGAISGVTEGVLEGVSGAAGKVGAKLFAKQTAKSLAKKGIVKGIISNFAGEAFEEGMSEFLDPYFQRWTKVDPEAKNATAQQIGYAALIGGLSGALMSGVGEVYGAAKQIVRGSTIASNSNLTKSTVDTARYFANYETEHATGNGAYTYVQSLVSQYDAAKPSKNGGLSLNQKRILGQMEAANTVLTFEPSVRRSKENILANAEEFVKAINERQIIDRDTGKPFHFNTVEEFTSNEGLVTQFAVADALGQLLMSKDSVYDAVSNKRTDGIMQSDFRNFQKEATPQQKKSINDLFGIDVDSISYDDFVEKIQTTSNSVFTEKQAELSAMAAAKKEISRVINTNEKIDDAKAINNKTSFKEGVSVFKVNEKTYAGITKTADGKYLLYLDGNISHPLSKSELVKAVKALLTPTSAASNAKTDVGQPQSAPTQLSQGQTGENNQTATAATTETEIKPSEKPTDSEAKPKKEPKTKKKETAKPKKKENTADTQKKETETAKKAQKHTENTEKTSDTDKKQAEIQKMKESEAATERVIGELCDLGVVDYETISSMKDGEKLDAVSEFAIGDLSDYERQGLYSAQSLAKAISEHAGEIRAGKKPFVAVMDRAIELDGKEMPKWYKEQYHPESIKTSDAKKETPKKSSTKKTTAKKSGPKLDKARARLVSLINNSKTRETLRGAFVKDGIQYVGDGTFAAAFTDTVSGLTEAEGIDFGRIMDGFRNKKTKIEVKIDSDAIRAVVPAKKSDFSMSLIGDTYFQTRIVSRVLDAIDSPACYLVEYSLDTKAPHNILYIKGKNGDAVIMPVNPQYYGNNGTKPVVDYTAEFKAENAVSAKEKPVTVRSAATKTETATQEKKTTEKKTRKTQDFGEKIGGARKDEWQSRGLTSADIEGMNTREIQKYAKKERVWKRPNWETAISEGGDRGLLYAQNELYKSLNNQPQSAFSYRGKTEADIMAAAKTYADEVSAIQKMAESAKTAEDFQNMGRKWLSENGYIEIQDARYKWTDKYYHSPALYGSNYLATVDRLVRNFATLSETSLMEGFGVSAENKLPRGYEIHSSRDTLSGSSSGTGKYYIVKGHYIVARGFNTINEAIAYGKEKFGTAATQKSNAKKRYIPKQLSEVHREGLDYRQSKNIVGDDFIHDFGIKGGEFGNWLSELDRTTSLNYGYDAFCDLADALNIEKSDIALNGTLSIGFGSRGQGLSGAVAHYEPLRKVINLTKMNGAGSLAHEWWHAFEDYISGDTHQADMTSDFSKIPEKTKQAAMELVRTMNYREATAEETNLAKQKRSEQNLRRINAFFDNNFSVLNGKMDQQTIQQYVDKGYYKRKPTDTDIKRYTELKGQAIKGDSDAILKFYHNERSVIDDLSDLKKEITGRGLQKEERLSLAHAMAYMGATPDVKVTKKTQYHLDAIAISTTYAKDGGYWDSNCEMLARAFAAYITDKTNASNDYLSAHSEGAVLTANGEAHIMPVGEERTRINAAFDKLFAAAKEDGLIHESTAEKPKTKSRYALTEQAQLNDQPAGNKSQTLKPLEMKRAENYARNNIKGYENLTYAEKLEVEWSIASGWRYGVDNAKIKQIAQIAAETGTGIGFADISAKNSSKAVDGVCYSRNGHKTIYLSPAAANNVETITLEELTHAFEGTEGYSDIAKMATEYYNAHPKEKAAIENAYKELYKNEEVLFAEEILPSELTAHYVREMLGNRNMLAKLTAEKPKFIQRCINWLKNFKKKAAAVDANVSADVQILENKFKALYNQNKSGANNVNTAAGSKFAIVSDNNGNQFVQADRRVIIGENPDVWKTQITKYINEVIRQGKDIKIKTVEGDTLTITKNTAGKAAFQNTGLSERAFKTKLNAEAHIDEIAQISKAQKNADGTKKIIPDYNNKHAKRNLARDGWNYRTAYFRDFDGKYYKLKLSVAIDGTVESIYNVGSITEKHLSGESRLTPQRATSVSNNSISKAGENVNKKYALSSKTDSEGRILSAEQQKYFAESKVKDDNGNLQVVYHGTNNEFFTFDKDRVGQGTDQFGAGYYFTTSKDGAERYGNRVISGYLNITKPFDITMTRSGGGIDQFYSQPVTQSQAYKILKMHPDLYSADDSPLGNYSEAFWTEGATESVIREVASQMKEIGNFADNSMFGYYPNELNAAIKKVMGYDGLRINLGNGEKFYVAFEQNQIKDINNVAPTSSVDIRYALSDTKGADRVMTELPNERITVKDVLTKKATREQITEQIKGDTKQYTEGFQIAMTNAQAAVERVMKEAGVDEATAKTNYVRAGKNAGMNALEMDGAQYSLDGETRVGESWGKIWQPIYTLNKRDGQAYAKFQEYLLHYHNIDRMAVGKPVFGADVTAADSRAAIAEIEAAYPQFKKIAEKVWKFNDNNLQLAVDSGMYSQEYADHLRELYPHYVPTMREEHAGGIAAIQGKNNIRVNNAKKKAVGAETRILPIDDTVAQQTLQKYSSARANKLLVDILNGKAHDEFKVISSEDANIDIDSDTLVKTVEDKAKNTHQITFYHDGKRITVETSRNFFKGIEAFQPSGDSAFNNAILNGAAKINSAFKKLVTSYNPFFSFFRNPMRDIQDAGLYTRYPLRKFAAAYWQARKEIANNGTYWQEAKAAGITSASVYDYEKGLNYKNQSAFKKATQKIEAASNAIEMAPRLAEYICSREAGLSVQESLLRAQDVTTNFGRGGIFAKKLNSTIMPFLNPAIQGFSKMVRAYTGKDAALSWGNLIVRSILLGLGVTALNDLLNSDDEDYQNLSDYVKENNYVIGFGDGNFIKIPKGRVVSVLGGAYLRSKWYAQGDEDAWDGYLKSISSAVTPVDNFTRTIFSPITDLATNTTWYGGTIEGQKFNDTKPSNRYDESTSSISIWLGKVFNYSPKKIDYLLDQYGGIVTDILLPATTMQAESGVVSKNLLANSTTNSRWSTEFYSQIEKYTYKKTDGDAQAKGTVKYLNSIKSTISDMYSQKRQIQADSSLSNSEKISQTQIIQAAINALMKDSLTNAKYLYEELGKYNLSDDKFDSSYIDAISTVIGAEYALKTYNKTVYEKAANLNKLGISYDTYYDYYFATKDITADVAANGKSVSGSRKAKLIQYTLSTNLPAAQKLILIMSSGYSISDGDISGLTAKKAKSLVAQYIAKSGLTSDEKTALAKMCGLTAINGKVYLN